VTEAYGKCDPHIQPLALSTLVEWLETGHRFALVRMGDGEFQCLRRQQGENCDGAKYSPEMAAMLRRVIENKSLMLCISSIAMHNGAREWIQENYPHEMWYDADVLIEANHAGELWPLRSVLFRRRMVYIGPEHLHQFALDALCAKGFVAVPLANAFDEIGDIEAAAHRAIEDYGADMVGVSAGPAAKILIDRLARVYPHVTFWDMGSEWDMYAGHPSRSGHKRLTPRQIDQLAWNNFHWERVPVREMPVPRIHELMLIPGLITEAEAMFLYDQAAAAPAGLYVELGSYMGRSGAMLARAARQTGSDVRSIDNYSYPGHPEVGEPGRNVAAHGLTVDFREGDSRIVPDGITAVTLLHVDSEHTPEHFNAEMDAWLPLVVKGGIIVCHDFGGNKFPAMTPAIMQRLGKYKLLGQVGHMVAFRKDGT
jgi:hypothetical protein